MYATVLEEMEWIWTMGKRLENCAGGEKMVWRTEKRNWQEKSKVKTSAGGSSRYMAGRSTHGRTRKCKESRRKEGRARSKGKEEGWPSTSVEGNLHIRHPMYSAKCADPLSRQAKQKARPESSTTASIQHPAGHLRWRQRHFVVSRIEFSHVLCQLCSVVWVLWVRCKSLKSKSESFVKVVSSSLRSLSYEPEWEKTG